MAAKNILVPKEVHLAQAGLTNLPNDWSVVEVEELLSPERGISVGVMYPGKHDPFGIPLLKVGDLAGSVINPTPEFRITPEKHYEYRRTALEGGELLLTLVGGLGQCAIVPPEMAGWNAARAIAVIRLKEPKDAKFVRLCLLSQPLQHLMQVWANTTVQATLNLKEIKQLPLPWPLAAEREAIAHILGTLDDKIELNREMNKTLEAMARAIFKSWFIDFAPVRAKMEGRQPAGMDAATAELFPDDFEESALGMIPKGWRFVTIKEVVEGVFDGPHATPQPSSTGAVFLGIKNFTGTSLDFSEIKRISDEDFPKWTKRVTPQEGDIVFTYEATLGYFALIPSWLRCCLGRRIALVRPKLNQQDGYFLFHTFIAKPFQDLLVAHVNPGSTVDRILLSEFPSYKILLPSKTLVSRFHQFVCPHWELIYCNQKQNKELADVRDTLLPKLLSGEIRVKEAEKVVETVL